MISVAVSKDEDDADDAALDQGGADLRQPGLPFATVC